VAAFTADGEKVHAVAFAPAAVAPAGADDGGVWAPVAVG
jgi:hypothetical protein